MSALGLNGLTRPGPIYTGVKSQCLLLLSHEACVQDPAAWAVSYIHVCEFFTNEFFWRHIFFPSLPRLPELLRCFTMRPAAESCVNNHVSSRLKRVLLQQDLLRGLEII